MTRLVARPLAPSPFEEERAGLTELGAGRSSRIGRCRACDRVYLFDGRELGSLRDGILCPVHGTELAQTTYLALASRGRGGTAELYLLEPAPAGAEVEPEVVVDEPAPAPAARRPERRPARGAEPQSELRERGLKRCPRCGEVKDRESAFTHRADGSVFSWCRDCNRAYRAERRERARGEQS